jgi:hypothetical protein
MAAVTSVTMILAIVATTRRDCPLAVTIVTLIMTVIVTPRSLP